MVRSSGHQVAARLLAGVVEGVGAVIALVLKAGTSGYSPRSFLCHLRADVDMQSSAVSTSRAVTWTWAPWRADTFHWHRDRPLVSSSMANSGKFFEWISRIDWLHHHSAFPYLWSGEGPP